MKKINTSLSVILCFGLLGMAGRMCATGKLGEVIRDTGQIGAKIYYSASFFCFATSCYHKVKERRSRIEFNHNHPDIHTYNKRESFKTGLICLALGAFSHLLFYTA